MEQPREPRFYPNNQESNGIMYEDIQIMEFKMRVAELESKERCNQEVSKDCIKEIAKLCEPLVRYLKENQDPYKEIVISSDFVKMKSEVFSVPNKVTEQW